MTGRVQAVVFDVLETLLDVEAIAERLEDVADFTAVGTWKPAPAVYHY